MLATPVSAEPSGHATSPDASASESPALLAGPQTDLEADSAANTEADADADPEIETVTGDPDSGDTETADTEPVDKPASQILVEIDKSTQHMTVFVDGVEMHNWPVSTGIEGYSTPSGTFTTSSMNKIWYSRQWDNAPMPHAVFFTKKGHAIHATNETKKLGKPASHGCVRLSPKNAETFFNLVKETGLENTQVVLAGVTPGGEYKVTQPKRRDRYEGRDRYGNYDRYGYYEDQPRVQRKRRRLFQPHYEAPPQQQRRRWFRRGY